MTTNEIIQNAFYYARKDLAHDNVRLDRSEYRVRIKVKGRGEFPIDQLRRFRLVPVTSFSSSIYSGPQEFELEFADSNVTESLVEQCAARFASFTWAVTDCTIFIDQLVAKEPSQGELRRLFFLLSDLDRYGVFRHIPKDGDGYGTQGRDELWERVGKARKALARHLDDVEE